MDHGWRAFTDAFMLLEIGQLLIAFSEVERTRISLADVIFSARQHIAYNYA